MAPTLRATANAMRQGLDWSRQAGKAKAWNMRSLPRGLQLLLSYEEERWRLALRRRDVAPAEEEIELCSAAFEVPEGCRRRNYTAAEKNGITHQKVVYYVVEMTWREPYPAPAPRPGSAQDGALCAAPDGRIA